MTRRFNYNAGISLHVPIYNGGRTKQQIKLAETSVKQHELAIETMNNNYQQRHQSGIDRYTIEY